MGGSSGTSRLHAIKAKLYNSGQRGEEIRDARKIAQEVRRGVRIFAHPGGKAVCVGNMLAMRAEVRGFTRRGIFVQWRGGRYGDGDTPLISARLAAPPESCPSLSVWLLFSLTTII